MGGYSAQEAAGLLELEPRLIEDFMKAGVVSPAMGDDGCPRLSFQDLVALRTAKNLLAARIPSSRVARMLEALRAQLPPGVHLSGVQVSLRGRRLVARDRDRVWYPDTGQSCFDFDDASDETEPTELPGVFWDAELEADMSAAEWFELGRELEQERASEARDAYRRALELDPLLNEARVHLGGLLYQHGQLSAAEGQYRVALALCTQDKVAAYQLGVVLEHQARLDDAIQAYRYAVALDARYKEAVFGLVRLLERTEQRQMALSVLSEYRRAQLGART